MKFEYDKDADAAYIYIVHPIKDGEAAKTIPVTEDINIDLDADGKLLGFEILNASKILRQKALLEAH